ncbi:TIGR02186 family protein [Methyloceanibacter caenitepidi]|uniref:TIGR02186 family protein n=1 Tax=Methyloceanibacter caenitepidi TaxID=1384459 RepID=UPI000693EE5A|nr:TIGR02186 family protein [Methyloceanibacter caenitepidi]
MRAALLIPTLLTLAFLAAPSYGQSTAPPAPVLKPGTSHERVLADISTREVAIQSNFSGIEIIIFGSIDFSDARMPTRGKYDVIALVRGPTEPITIRRKTRVGGIWVNGPSATYPDAPSFYAVLSSRPVRAIASNDTLKELDIGLSELNFGRETAGSPQEQSFESALIRLMEERGLYTEDDSGVVFIGRSLFRSTVALPTNVPTGRYRVEVYLFRDGTLASKTKGSLEVNKAGMEATIYNLAFHQPFLYGLLGIAIAVLAGLMGWFAFRKD